MIKGLRCVDKDHEVHTCTEEAISTGRTMTGYAPKGGRSLRDSPGRREGPPPGQASASSHPWATVSTRGACGVGCGWSGGEPASQHAMGWGEGRALARGSLPCPLSSGRNPPQACVARRSLQGVSDTSQVGPRRFQVTVPAPPSLPPPNTRTFTPWSRPTRAPSLGPRACVSG